MGGGEHTPDERLTVRPATFDDLDDVLEIILANLSTDPQFDYRFPYRDRYPEDNRSWMRLEYQEFIEDPKKYALMIVTASDYNDKPVAVACWDICLSAPILGGDLGVPDDPAGEVRRKDADPAQYRAWKQQITDGFMKYLMKYGFGQMHLWMLFCLPEFRGRGAEERLTRWGVERGLRQSNNASTALPTEKRMKKLYEKLGFNVQGKIIIRVDDSPKSLLVWAMAREP